MICDCGRKATKIKWNHPVCERCDACEQKGCTGGPTNSRVGMRSPKKEVSA